MLTVVEIDNSQIIALPPEEMEKLGLVEGDEVELSKNANDEIVLRLKSNQRNRQILETTRKIIERRRSALIELGKGHEWNDVFFPSSDEILLIHTEIIKETGGSDGLRDAGALESALKAAENRLFYETDSLAILAATYAYHLSQAHAFVDGNKRIAAVVAELFLNLNGMILTATNDEIIEVFLEIAASKLSREEIEEKFAAWTVKAG